MLLLDVNILRSLLITPYPCAWCLLQRYCFYLPNATLINVNVSLSSQRQMSQGLSTALHTASSLLLPCLFLSEERFSNIFLLTPCICSRNFCALVGLGPVHSQVSFASVLWVITSPVNLFDHFDDRLTSACKDDLIFPGLQAVEGREIRPTK